MKLVIYSLAILLLILAAPLLRKVKVEYRTLDRLSPRTAIQVWVLYIVLVVLAIWSALLTLWSIPLANWLAVAGGTILLIAGAALSAAGIATFGSLERMSGTKTDRLITNGIYRWSRHPQNVGLGVALVGAALIGRSAFTLLLAGLFWILFRIYLPMEEAFLRRTFGDAYQRYRAETSPYFAPPKELS